MATTPLLDPYKTLGVDPDADSTAIKKAYRQLALVCHPDKVTDENLKSQKQEEFHKIQQAYETIGDPDNRAKYDLELEAKKLREERDRMPPTRSRAPPPGVKINIYTARHPSEKRSSSYEGSPTKSASYKSFPSGYSQSREQGNPPRSGASQWKGTTRRTYSDEKTSSNSEREQKRRDDDRERERERERRRQQKEEDERYIKHLKRENERLEREKERQERANEAAERKLRQEQEDRMRVRAKAEKRAKERAAEERKKQDAADERLRAKTSKRQEQLSEDDDDINRTRRKKDKSRDKSPSRFRHPKPSTADDVETKLNFAASYIRGQQSKNAGKASSKHTASRPFSSEAYPDPNEWVPKNTATEPVIIDAGSPPISPSTYQTPPRPPKSYRTYHRPEFERPPTLNRSHTYGGEGLDPARPRLFRQRTSLDDDGHSTPRLFRRHPSLDDDEHTTPRVRKFSVKSGKGGMPRTVTEESTHRDWYPYEVETTRLYGADDLRQSKPYDPYDIAYTEHVAPAY